MSKLFQNGIHIPDSHVFVMVRVFHACMLFLLVWYGFYVYTNWRVARTFAIRTQHRCSLAIRRWLTTRRPVVEDAVAHQLHGLLRQRRLQRATAGFILAANALWVPIAFGWIRMYRMGVWTNTADLEYIRGVLYRTELRPTALAMFVALLGCSLPRIMTEKFLDFIHASFCLMVLIVCVLYPDPVELFYRSGTNVSSRIVVAIILGNARLTAVLNITLTFVDVINYANLIWEGALPGCGLVRPFHNLERGASLQYFAREAFACVIIVGIAWMVEMWMKKEARATLEVKEKDQTEATIHNLLSAICDAVVTLGPGFEITKPVPKLSGLLLRCHSGGNGLQNSCFMDLVSESDRDRLSERLINSACCAGEAAQPAPMLPVRLKDSNNQLVRVDLFYSSFSNMIDEPCHIVGIREVVEAGWDALQHEESLGEVFGSALSMRPDRIATTARAMVIGLPDSISATDSSCSFSSHGSSVSFNSGKLGRPSCIIWINGLSPELDIIRSSLEFQALGYTCTEDEDAPFLHWVAGENGRADFLKWVQDTVNNAMSGSGATEAGPRFLRLRCPATPLSHEDPGTPGVLEQRRLFEFRAQCRLSVELQQADFDVSIVRLVLSNVTSHRRRDARIQSRRAEDQIIEEPDTAARYSLIPL